MHTVVLIRHGESTWNKENRFTGWTDVPLSEKGIAEAKEGGKVLAYEKYSFDLAYTSVLKRAIKTLYLVLEEMDLMWLPVIKNWRLNERHYGALQGLNKSETAKKHGEEQVKIWRRSFDIAPPKLDKDSQYYPGKDPRYKDLSEQELPLAESLKSTCDRFVPYWENTIKQSIQSGKKILIAAHGNSLRALVKHIDNVSEKDILALNIPTGVPLVYKLDDNLNPIKAEKTPLMDFLNCYPLGDIESIKKAQEAVKNQGK